jgi:hypothetical protein
VVGVAGGKAKGVFQDKLEGGAGGFRDVQKNNHWICAAIIGVWRGKVNLDFGTGTARRVSSERLDSAGNFPRMFLFQMVARACALKICFDAI